MNIIKNSMRLTHKMRVWEISIFKLYLFVIALLAARRIPELMEVSAWVYVIIALALLIPLVVKLCKEHGNYVAKIFSQWNTLHLFKKWTMVDVAMFKTGMLAVGLLAAKVFPVLLSAHLGVYLVIFGFGAGYFVAKMLQKN